MSKRSKHFKTYAKDLFSRVNIQEDNIRWYCKNHDCSESMLNKLLAFRVFVDTYIDCEEYTLDEALRDFSMFPNFIKQYNR